MVSVWMLTSPACSATNYEGGMTELLNSMGFNTSTAQSSNIFTASGDINVTQNLGSFATTPTAVTAVTLNGATHTLSGAVAGTPTYSGLNVGSGQVLRINNFGSYNSSTGTVNSAIQNFTSSSPNGAFLNNAGTFVSSSNVYNNNSVITSSATVSDGAYGSAVYNSGAFASNGDVYKGNYTSATSGTARAFAYGGAIYNNSGTANISNATFDGNYVKSTSVGATNGTDNSWAFGGAIFNASTMNLIGSNKFTNNYAQAYTSASGTFIAAEGGAIYNNGTITVLGNNNTFGNNYVLGGSNYGGAILNYSTFTMSGLNNVFSGNYSSQGGAFYNAGTATATISNASFSDNGFITINSTPYLTSSGGAVLNCKTMTLNSNIFTNNVASIGGAIDNYTGTMTITNGNFISNGITSGGTPKTGSGGAIFQDVAGILYDSGSTYTSNQASSYGGAIYNSGIMNVSGDSFTNNISPWGGAVYNYNVSTAATPVYATGILSGDTFTSNGVKTDGTIFATSGGGIENYARASSSGTASTVLSISNSIFDKNAANSSGGAVYNLAYTLPAATATAVATSTLNFYNTKLGESASTGNSVVILYSSGASSAIANGGAIGNYAWNQSVTAGAAANAYLNVLSGSSFNSNYAQATVNGTGTSYSTAYGGAIYNMANNTPNGTAAAYANLYGTTFSGNYANASSVASYAQAYGGALYNNYSGTGATAVLNIFNTDFSNNYVSAPP